MSGFFKRLAVVIHWFGFLASALIAYAFITETSSNPLWISIMITLMPNTAGWLIKFIFTGDGKFLPF